MLVHYNNKSEETSELEVINFRGEKIDCTAQLCVN